MTASASVTAQAKINLLLRVLPREETGYHSLETVFLRLELGDEVRVRIAAGCSVDCAGPAVPHTGLGPTESNLAYRAAVAYAGATGWPSGFAVEIEKHIPVGGGLGGGSADAGAVLRALDALAPNPIGSRLVELSGPLGADVPFMTATDAMALAWGRGERLYPLPPLDARAVAIVVPPFGVSTADAYAWLAADRGRYEPMAHVLAPATLSSWPGIAQIAENDFEPVIARRHPLVATMVADLRAAGAVVAMMSGSGSTVFGIFDEASDARTIERTAAGAVVMTQTATTVASVQLG